MIHFELVFTQGVRFRLKFIFLHMDIQLFQHDILKRLSFLYRTVFAVLSKNQPIIFVSLFLDFLYCFKWSACLCLHHNHCLEYRTSQQVLKLSSVVPPTLLFFCNTVLAIIVPLPFHVNFRISMPMSTRKFLNCIKFTN